MRWLMIGVAAMVAATSAIAQTVDAGQASDPTGADSAPAQIALITAYRTRLAEETINHPGNTAPDSQIAARILAAEPEDLSVSSIEGAYRCETFGTVEGYDPAFRKQPGVYVYRSGTFACVIERGSAGLRLRKVSGQPLEAEIAQTATGLLTFTSDYHAGLIMPKRPWFIEALGPDTLRIIPFEPGMQAELSRPETPLTGASLTFLLLTRR